MKRFLIGIIVGFLIGICLTAIPSVSADDDNPRSYKQYLAQMLKSMREVNAHLEQIELNTKAVRDKLHA